MSAKNSKKRKVLAEEQGVLKEARTLAKTALNYILDNINEHLDDVKFTQTFFDLGHQVFLCRQDVDFFNKTVTRIVSNVHIFSSEYLENHEMPPVVHTFIPAKQEITLTIILLYENETFFLYGDARAGIAHELVHAYQTSIAHIKKNLSYHDAYVLYNQTTDELLKIFYYSIYYFSLGEITANVTRLYEELCGDYIIKKSREECVNCECYANFLKTKENLAKAISFIDKNSIYQNLILRKLGHEYNAYKKMILNNIKVAQVKFDKVINYYLSSPTLVERACLVGTYNAREELAESDKKRIKFF